MTGFWVVPPCCWLGPPDWPGCWDGVFEPPCCCEAVVVEDFAIDLLIVDRACFSKIALKSGSFKAAYPYCVESSRDCGGIVAKSLRQAALLAGQFDAPVRLSEDHAASIRRS